MTETTAQRLFDEPARSGLARLTRLDTVPGGFESASARSALAEAEILVTAWGSPQLDATLLAAAPRLRALFHAGGTVRRLVTDASWDRGIVVVSAAAANAVPVAEFTLAAVLYAGKRIPLYARKLHASRGGSWASRSGDPAVSNYRRVVGLVGLSRIGRRVADLLRPFDLDVLAADPYATPELAMSLGVTLTDLDDLVRRSDVVSLHAPSLPSTRHLIDARRLSVMRDGATLINTARGALVDTDALTKELVAGRLHAVLDVTDPEPLPADSPLYDLPNVQLTPHLAGSTGTELFRMGGLVVAEIARYLDGAPLRHQVRRADMDHVA
ncbi:hydroxyacid dehydrogenase [Jiangella alkaliphila]|nr:hydroxyacid dehydrogenase [Jiangella alkaliphila]